MTQIEGKWGDGDGAPKEYEYIDEIEWRGESWEFDITRFYRRRSDGAVFYGTDTGCSCPIPFEHHTEEDLTQVRRLQDIYDHFMTRESEMATPFVADQINRVVFKLDEILRPEQRPFGAIKHAA